VHEDEHAEHEKKRKDVRHERMECWKHLFYRTREPTFAGD
jgi:hypothetical protein